MVDKGVIHYLLVTFFVGVFSISLWFWPYYDTTKEYTKSKIWFYIFLASFILLFISIGFMLYS
jgi:hypothetical protein